MDALCVKQNLNQTLHGLEQDGVSMMMILEMIDLNENTETTSSHHLLDEGNVDDLKKGQRRSCRFSAALTTQSSRHGRWSTLNWQVA